MRWIACLLLVAGCQERPQLVVFHAGSLSVPFRELGRLFHKRHPRVELRAEGAGSRDTARKVSDLGRRCDVLGSADYKVVDELLVPRHAAFNIRFATNEMVIAYTDRSRHAAELTARNWPEILLRPEVRVGRADPERDPCGYRTVMLFQLAERHQGVAGLAGRLQRKGGRRFIRPKETDLLALLEAGEIDYMFIYRSVASQHGLRALRLPDEVNLRAPEMGALYHTAQVEVTGARPGQKTTLHGSPIVYSVTIPTSAKQPGPARAFVELLLSPAGQRVMRRLGQEPLSPPLFSGELPRGLAGCCRRVTERR